MIKFLIDRGADTSLTDRYGRTARELLKGKVEMIELLIDHGHIGKSWTDRYLEAKEVLSAFDAAVEEKKHCSELSAARLPHSSVSAQHNGETSHLSKLSICNTFSDQPLSHAEFKNEKTPQLYTNKK